MADSRRICELCNHEASVYCPSDSAFLCWTCDSKVHNANFLVARHVRSLICRRCRNLDGRHFSGVGISIPATKPCRSCLLDKFTGEAEADSLSPSSSCVSSTTEAGEEAVSKRRGKKEKIGGGAVDLKVEGVLVNWCRRMGVEERKGRQVISATVELLGGCLDKMTVSPFRISLAAAFWVALRLCGEPLNLRRVEQITGVPAKLIVATESRLARAIKGGQSRESHEEGWAEC